MSRARYVIVGAGFAGAATAYHLARKGAGEVLLLEREKVAGFHSSGRNASMVRQVVPGREVTALAVRGTAFLRRLPADWPLPVSYEQNGSLLLGRGSSWEKLLQDAAVARAMGVEAEVWQRERAIERVPLLERADFEGAIWCPTDGVVDIHALLQGYLKAAAAHGAKVLYGAPVLSVEVAGGRVKAVVAPSGRIEADVLVNAAGPWARALADMAGAVAAPLRPCRRHLFLTEPLPWVDRRWPFVWDVAHGLYFRPDSDGLLLCPCDEEELPPGDTPVDGAAAELLAEKVRDYLPAAASVGIRKSWAGLRTLSPDGRFVIGWDPQVEGFFWVAGLGGHGVTTSSAAGEMAAELMRGGKPEFAEAFSPRRFLLQRN